MMIWNFLIMLNKNNQKCFLKYCLGGNPWVGYELAVPQLKFVLSSPVSWVEIWTKKVKATALWLYDNLMGELPTPGEWRIICPLL